MFGSVVLDVAIGLSFVYLIMSLICSALREGIEARLKTRALLLERGIRELLKDAGGNQLAEKLYKHPLVSSLYRGNYQASVDPGKKLNGLSWIWAVLKSWIPRANRTDLPSYIPARNFALALLDLAGRGTTDQSPSGNVNAQLSVEQIRANVAQLGNPDVARAVLIALDPVKDDVELAIQNVQKWYESGMDRVSGWYKHETQKILFMLALIVTVVFNVDSIAIVKHLAIDKQARERVSEAATASVLQQVQRNKAAADKMDKTSVVEPGAVKDDSVRGGKAKDNLQDQLKSQIAEADEQTRILKEQLYGLSLPIGWSEKGRGAERRDECTKARELSWIAQTACDIWPHDLKLIIFAIPGWLITAFAISFGAPFWFDLLNKIMVVRSTVKPREKSPEEGSEDRSQASKP